MLSICASVNSQRSFCSLLLFPIPYRLIWQRLRCLKPSVIFLLKEKSDSVEHFLVGCCVQNGLENCEKERKKMPMISFPLLKQSIWPMENQCCFTEKNSRNYKAAKMGLSSTRGLYYHGLLYTIGFHTRPMLLSELKVKYDLIGIGENIRRLSRVILKLI